MSRNKKKNNFISTPEEIRKTTSECPADEEEISHSKNEKSAASKTKKTTQNVLNDIFGSTPAIDIPELPHDKIEFSIDEDRTRLLVEGLLLLVFVIVLFFVILLLGVVANTTGNVWLLLLIIAAVTVVWFVTKRVGLFLRKFFNKVGVIDFGEKYVYIYDKDEIKKATVVRYSQIKAYGLMRQGNALRLLLWGDWVKHPAGYLYIGINRPFKKDTLESLQAKVIQIMKSHHIKEKNN
jgi:hypothetical protein